MTDVAISWAFFLGYLALVGTAAFVGIRRVKSFTSFSVGDRKTSPVWVGLALAANLAREIAARAGMEQRARQANALIRVIKPLAQ